MVLLLIILKIEDLAFEVLIDDKEDLLWEEIFRGGNLRNNNNNNNNGA